MVTALQIILILILLFVIYQDVKSRTIHIVLPVAVFIITLYINHNVSYLELSGVFPNILFILINMIGLVLYTSLRNGKMSNPINKTMGMGDVLFFIALTPLFNLKPFILFFVSGLLFSLVLFGFNSLFKKVKTIPLAGYLALFLVLNMASHFVVNKSFLF